MSAFLPLQACCSWNVQLCVPVRGRELTPDHVKTGEPIQLR